jgi:hypothetical protein
LATFGDYFYLFILYSFFALFLFSIRSFSLLGECDIQFEVESATGGQAEENKQQGGRTQKSQNNKRGGVVKK